VEAQSKHKKKVYYFSPYDILRPRTNQISDVRFCEGFVQNNCDITLVVPYTYRKDNIKKKAVLDFYGVEDKYKVCYLPTLFLGDTDGKAMLLVILILNSFLYLWILFKSIFQKGDIVIISRSPILLFPFLRIRSVLKSRIKIISWIHEIKKNKADDYVYKNADFLWGTNSSITNDLKEMYHFSDDVLGVTNNPVTESQVRAIVSKVEARKIIKLDTSPLIVYTGKLFIDQLEVKYLMEAAKELPQYTFLFTGGKPNVVKHYQEWCSNNNMSNVILVGYLHDYTQLKYYQQAADVLVSYYTSKEHDLKYNLPQKIVEYMLTGNPIVTPNFAATQDVLNEENAIFVEPENTESLKKGLIKAAEDRELSEQMAKRAFESARNYTFKKSIQKLLTPVLK
jgi:glycosyltransferase involved in cell wall biosynthesis